VCASVDVFQEPDKVARSRKQLANLCPPWDSEYHGGGRPPLPPNKRRSYIYTIRLSPDDVAGLVLLAKERKCRVATLIREAALLFLSQDILWAKRNARARGER
jgi:hypothetical protein